MTHRIAKVLIFEHYYHFLMYQHQIQTPMGAKSGIVIQCPNILSAGRKWNYTGTRTVYATCPNCKKPVRIEDHKIKIDADGVGAHNNKK